METQEQAKEKRVRKEYTAEDLQAMSAAVETLKAVGVSENFAKVLETAGEWQKGKEAQAAAKKALAEHFATPEAAKEYFNGAFETDMAAFAGIKSLMTQANAVAGYFKRRDVKVKRSKVKTINVSINKKVYQVNKEYYESLNQMTDKDEKRNLLLNHPDTKEFTPTCSETL